MTLDKVQGEAVQVGSNNIINIINHIYTTNSQDTKSPVQITKSTQTSLKGPHEAALVTWDMNGNEVQLEEGDTLEVEFQLFAANAIYIGAGMSVCVREQMIVKERLYMKKFCKRRTEFKPGVKVFNRTSAVQRAKERLGEIFTGGSSVDFVSWCYTGLKRKGAC